MGEEEPILAGDGGGLVGDEAGQAPMNLREEINAWFAAHFQNQTWMQTETYNKLTEAKEDLLARLKV